MDSPKSILILRNGRLGDFLVSTPAIYFLRKLFPNTKLTWLYAISSNVTVYQTAKNYAGNKSIPPWFDIIEENLIDHVIIIDPENPVRTTSQIINKIKELQIDTVLNLPYSWQSYLSSIKKMIYSKIIAPKARSFGFWNCELDSTLSKIAYNFESNQIIPPINAVCQLRNFFKIDSDVDKIHFPLKKFFLEDKYKYLIPYFVVSPGSTHKHKRWPIENFINCIQLIKDRYNLNICITGLEQDRELAQLIVKRFPNISLDLTGQLNLTELAGIISNAKFCLTNDGGTAHLASALGCKAITVFSGVLPKGMWEPWDSREHSIRQYTKCSPCKNEYVCPIGTSECIFKINPEIVANECLKILL